MLNYVSNLGSRHFSMIHRQNHSLIAKTASHAANPAGMETAKYVPESCFENMGKAKKGNVSQPQRATLSLHCY